MSQVKWKYYLGFGNIKRQQLNLVLLESLKFTYWTGITPKNFGIHVLVQPLDRLKTLG